MLKNSLIFCTFVCSKRVVKLCIKLLIYNKLDRYQK